MKIPTIGDSLIVDNSSALTDALELDRKCQTALHAALEILVTEVYYGVALSIAAVHRETVTARQQRALVSGAH